jgi:hypothetical protein
MTALVNISLIEVRECYKACGPSFLLSQGRSRQLSVPPAFPIFQKRAEIGKAWRFFISKSRKISTHKLFILNSLNNIQNS